MLNRVPQSWVASRPAIPALGATAMLSCRIQVNAPSTDQAIAVMASWRTVAELLPFQAVQPLRLRPGPLVTISFQVQAAGDDERTVIAVAPQHGAWRGGFSCSARRVLARHGLIAAIRLHLTVAALLDAADVAGIVVHVDDASGWWRHRTLRRLVRYLDAEGTHVAALPAALQALLQDFDRLQPGDPSVDVRLAIRPLEALLACMEQEGGA